MNTPDANGSYRASIDPTVSVSRPQWSVLIPTWNCAVYLEESLSSVLEQDRGADNMEIIVVDDHSTKDDPEEVVRRLGGERVRFIRQERNVGKVRNYETGLAVSAGRLIHQLHGDDRVKKGFYFAMEDAFDRFADAGAFFCESRYIDSAGNETGRTGLERDDVGLLDNWLESIAVAQRIQTPSMVVRREVYEALGGFDRRLDAFEDWEMWVRIATAFRVGFIPAALAEYRTTAGNATELATLSGRNRKTLRTAIAIIDTYLDPKVIERIRTARNQAQAQFMIQFIPQLMQKKRYSATIKAGLDALSFSRDPRTLYRMMNYALTWKRLVSA